MEQRAVDDRAIVIDQLDDPRLRDKPAKLDQLSGSLAPLHLPLALIMARVPKRQATS
jgi:hypothetical protein